MSKSAPRRSLLLLSMGLLALAIIAWQFYKYKLVHRKIDDTVSTKTKGLYTISYDKLSLAEMAGALHVKNIEITPDTAVYHQMVLDKRDPPVLLRLKVPALDILGVKTPKALLKKEIEGTKVEIDGASIEIQTDPSKKGTPVYNPAGDISKQLLGKLLQIKVDTVLITHANVMVRNIHTGREIASSLDVSFLFSDLLIDSTTGKDSSRILFAKQLDINCDKIALPIKNKRYKLDVAGLRFTSHNNALSVHQVRIIPQLPENEFAHSFPVQKDRYDFLLEDISLQAIDRESLWHRALVAEAMTIGKSSFKVYRDLSRPPDTTSKVGKYPQQLLMRLPFPVNIRRLTFEHSFIEYKEKNARSDSAGRLRFFDANATLTNVTNRKRDILQDNKCVLKFKARLFNTTPVDARLVMLLNDPHGKFSIEGDIGAIDVKVLNPLTRPMGLARMDKGAIHQLHFDITGTDSTGNGTVLLLYDDLKISLLKKDKEEGTLNKKVLVSLFANFVIKNSNGGENPRVAEVHFDRILNKSFFNLIWKTVFTGIKKSVGMK
ncbi:MAG TPA: hypothetical protein VL727_04585 [Puia sp.]|nr:hypothetical protein [Puia sp.]